MMSLFCLKSLAHKYKQRRIASSSKTKYVNESGFGECGWMEPRCRQKLTKRKNSGCESKLIEMYGSTKPRYENITRKYKLLVLLIAN